MSFSRVVRLESRDSFWVSMNGTRQDQSHPAGRIAGPKDHLVFVCLELSGTQAGEHPLQFLGRDAVKQGTLPQQRQIFPHFFTPLLDFQHTHPVHPTRM